MVERVMDREMNIVVKGRNVEVPEHFRALVQSKVERLERYDQKLFRIDVELFHEPNPRQTPSCQRVELTCRTRGPVIRAEACAENFYAALDSAVGKLESRMRRGADRRNAHHRSRTPMALSEGPSPELDGIFASAGQAATTTLTADPAMDGISEDMPEHLPGQVVREKKHAAVPMTIDQALFEMEQVGHDFYLFQDQESGLPSVVYSRKGYDYGVIRLSSDV